MEANIDENIILHGFESSSPYDLSKSVNTWLDENREDIILKKFVERAIDKYYGIIIYYVKKEKDKECGLD
jgi:hypothetical protein